MEIIVHSPDPRHISPKEAAEIARAIQSSYMGTRVRAKCTQRTGRGITLHEVLAISISGAAWLGKEMLEDMAKKIVEIVVYWARRRFARRNRTQPIFVTVRGPDGRVVISVRIKATVREPEDHTIEDRRREDDAKRRRAGGSDRDPDRG